MQLTETHYKVAQINKELMDFNTCKFQVESDFKHSRTQGQKMENKNNKKCFRLILITSELPLVIRDLRILTDPRL